MLVVDITVISYRNGRQTNGQVTASFVLITQQGLTRR